MQTPAGKVQVRWDGAGAVTPLGQLAYFIEFLHLTGLWGRWRDSCPLSYSSPNAPGKAEVLGAWLLSILAGHRRYAHVTAMRGRWRWPTTGGACSCDWRIPRSGARRSRTGRG